MDNLEFIFFFVKLIVLNNSAFSSILHISVTESLSRIFVAYLNNNTWFVCIHKQQQEKKMYAMR